MASATGIPEALPGRTAEEEPLLGHAGVASQAEGRPMYENLWLGTGVVAQAGIWVLAAIVWGAVFSHKLIFFSPHPLLNSAGLLLLTQATLIVQPTHTSTQKREGTYLHAGIHGIGLVALLAGLIIIEINKQGPGHAHFESPHAILGLITYIFLLLQAAVGFTQYFTPALYGSMDRAKSVYKYHRMSGYLVLLLGLATVCAATRTEYSVGVLGIQLWAVIVASVLVVLGIVPRIRLHKLGLKR